jgi:alpha-methylacyl-CoA racemase
MDDLVRPVRAVERAVSGPLAGVKVVELAGVGPGPFCAMLLADLGADVVCVDRLSGGGPVGGDPRYDLLNRGKRSIEVDLKHELGPELVQRLVTRADVLIEGYRPGVAERLRVGPEECWARNPRLVYGRMTGWGQEGPLARTAGHDVDYLAVSGVLGAIGRAGGPPQIPLNLLGEFGGGALYLAVGLLAALRDAERTGRGQIVDAAIVDGAAHLATAVFGALAAGDWHDERGANLLDTGAPFYDVYETRDGRYLAVGPLEPKFYAQLVELLGGGFPPQFDFASWPELRRRLATTFATRTRDDWMTVFDGTDACVAPVLSWREAPQHPHLKARGTFELHHGIVQPAPAPRFSATPAELTTPPALPGEHTRDVLHDWGVGNPDHIVATGVARQRESVEA